MERWKQVPQEYGNYEASNLGRIRHSVNKNIKKTRKNKNGYELLSLNIPNRKKRSECVHRIIGKCFIPNLYNLAEINHKDGNKSNNCFDNLEWCTAADNSKHAIATGLVKNCKKKVK